MSAFTDTVSAVSSKMFIRRELSRPWARVNPLVQMMLTRDLSPKRQFNVGRILKAVDTVPTAEAYKWGVEISAPAMTEAEAGLDIYYNRNATYNFTIDDNKKDASNTPKLAHFPCTIAASDMNVFAQATDNERGVKYVYNKQVSSLHEFQTRIENSLTAAAQVAGKIDSLLATVVKATGTSMSIDQAAYPIWAAKASTINGRLLIDTIASTVRSDRRRGASREVLFTPEGTHDLLVTEARSLGMPMYNLVDLFGRRSNGEPILDLELVVSVFRVEGVPIVPLPSLTGKGMAIKLSMDDIALETSTSDNFEFLPWKNVEIEAGRDQQRSLFKTAHFVADFDRSHHRLYNAVSEA